METVQDHMSSVVRSIVSVKTPGDINTLTIVAATSTHLHCALTLYVTCGHRYALISYVLISRSYGK